MSCRSDCLTKVTRGNGSGGMRLSQWQKRWRALGRDGTKFRHGLYLVNYGSTLAELVETFGYTTTERLRGDSRDKVIRQLERAGLRVECETDRWGRDDKFELIVDGSVASPPNKRVQGEQTLDLAGEAAESGSSNGLHAVELPRPFWPTALGLEEQRELAFLRALTEAEPILCLLDASEGDGWLQPVWEGVISWAFRGAQRFCHRALYDTPRCHVSIGSPAMLQTYLRTSVLAQDGPRLEDQPHSLNLVTLSKDSEKPVDFLRLRAVWPGPVFEFKPQAVAPSSDLASDDTRAVLDCVFFAAGSPDGAVQSVSPAHALIWARDACSEASARASANLGFLRRGSVEKFKGSNESGTALGLKARLAQWIRRTNEGAELKFENSEVLTTNDDNEVEGLRRVDLSVDGHRYEVETLLGSGPIEAFYQQKVFARLQKDGSPLSLVVPSEAFLWAGPYLADLAYHLSDQGKVLLPGMDNTFLQLKPRALRELIATPEIPWENMRPMRLDRANAGAAAETDAQIKLKEIAGYDEIKRLVDDLILWPEKNRRFINVSRTSGILFFGPPGCGKSRLARAIAGELEQEVRLLAPADLRGAYISWGQIMIREHFDWVAENERRMLVIDELDAVARSRRNNGNMHTDEMADVNELLVQLDRVSRLGRIVVGTTNYVGSLDDAIIRSGRFGTFIPVPPPDLDAAAKIVMYYLSAVTSAGGARVRGSKRLPLRTCVRCSRVP